MKTYNNQVTLSVIVPVYNVENYIEKCIHSIAFNLINDTEILIIDDGSTDRSGEIAELLKLKYPNIKVFHKMNGGLSDARNYGIHKAIGKYLMFIDGDDYVDESISGIFKYLDKEVDVVFVGMNVEKIKESKEILYKNIGTLLGNEDISRKCLTVKTNKNSACMKVVKKQFLLENSLFFNNGFSEDFNWTGRLFCHLNSAISTELNYYHYIAERQGSIMNNFNKKKFYDVIEHANSILREMDNKTLNQFTRKRIKQYVGFNLISIFRNINKCSSKAERIEISNLLKDNYNLIKNQRRFLMKSFVMFGRMFGFDLAYSLIK